MVKNIVTFVALFFFASASAQECVILLHGLARTSKSMLPMQTRLESEKYRVANISYPSRKKPIRELAPLAVGSGVKACGDDASQIHFVTHSLGGILVRFHLSKEKLERLGRVVMLAPPNQGSEVVDNLKNVPGYKFLNGPAGIELGTDPKSIPSNLGPVNFYTGIIAGTSTFNPLLSQFLPNPDDGKVSVESTKVEGMKGFTTVSVSHPFIMRDKNVMDLTVQFLQSGNFDVKLP